MEDGSESLLVVELQPNTPIDRYNYETEKMQNPQHMVKRGDRIVLVGDGTNEKSDVDGMRELFQKESVVLSIERWPQEVSIILKKRNTDDKYGMQTDLIIRDDGSKVLRVGRISGGLLGEWNSLAESARRFFDVVGQFSEIVKVNGQSTDPEKMQQLLVTEWQVQVTFVRPDPDLYSQ